MSLKKQKSPGKAVEMTVTFVWISSKSSSASVYCASKCKMKNSGKKNIENIQIPERADRLELSFFFYVRLSQVIIQSDFVGSVKFSVGHRVMQRPWRSEGQSSYEATKSSERLGLGVGCAAHIRLKRK